VKFIGQIVGFGGSGGVNNPGVSSCGSRLPAAARKCAFDRIPKTERGAQVNSDILPTIAVLMAT